LIIIIVNEVLFREDLMEVALAAAHGAQVPRWAILLGTGRTSAYLDRLVLLHIGNFVLISERSENTSELVC
jgi:hypothetical protein